MQDIYTDGSCIGNPGPGGWGVVGPGMRVSGGQDNTIAIWVPLSILLLGIATTTYMISRNGKSEYAKLK